MDTLVFASLMGLYYWFARLRLGYTFSAMLLQPVVIAVFVGLLLGNMETAMIIGAGMQLVYLGVTSTPGGNVPSDPALAACISIPIAVKAGMDPNLAIALAIRGQQQVGLDFSLVATFGNAADVNPVEMLDWLATSGIRAEIRHGARLAAGFVRG